MSMPYQFVKSIIIYYIGTDPLLNANLMLSTRHYFYRTNRVRTRFSQHAVAGKLFHVRGPVTGNERSHGTQPRQRYQQNIGAS